MTRPHALVIGGTRGLGLAMARECLARGMSVTVASRHPEALRDSGDAFTTLPDVTIEAVDAGDADAVRRLVEACVPSGAHLELLVVTAGTYFNSRTHALGPDEALALMRTNLGGVAHAFEAGARRMLAQRRGRLAAVSSMAGLLKDYPGASTYAASKRAVLALCDAWRKAVAPFGVTVTALVPGYVDTARLRELNGGDASHKPFLMREDDAARRMLDAVLAGAPRLVFPARMRWIVALLNLLPRMPRLPDFQPPRKPRDGPP